MNSFEVLFDFREAQNFSKLLLATSQETHKATHIKHVRASGIHIKCQRNLQHRSWTRKKIQVKNFETEISSDKKFQYLKVIKRLRYENLISIFSVKINEWLGTSEISFECNHGFWVVIGLFTCFLS